jgi:ribonuclease HI
MELTAAIKALEGTAPGSTVLVYTASQLVQQGMTGWVHKWLHNGWCTGAGQPVENQDLWERLRHLDEERRVRWEWLNVPMAKATDGQPQHHQDSGPAPAAGCAASTSRPLARPVH